jgi:hypothetical protein
MKRFFIIISCLIIALIGAVFFLIQRMASVAHSPAGQPSLSFVGFTELLPQDRHAIFSLTNGSHRILFVPDSVEQFVDGVWTTTKLTHATILHDFRYLRGEVGAGQAFTFHVKPPTNNTPWRMRFLCDERRAFGSFVASSKRYFVCTPEIPQ